MRDNPHQLPLFQLHHEEIETYELGGHINAKWIEKANGIHGVNILSFDGRTLSFETAFFGFLTDRAFHRFI